MATSIRSRLGKRIQALRKERGWRQIDLAVHADLSKTHICEVETGKREMGIEALARVAEALNITLSELLRGI